MSIGYDHVIIVMMMMMLMLMMMLMIMIKEDVHLEMERMSFGYSLFIRSCIFASNHQIMQVAMVRTKWLWPPQLPLNVSFQPRFPQNIGSKEESKCFNFPHLVGFTTFEGSADADTDADGVYAPFSSQSFHFLLSCAYQNGHTLSPHMLGGPINFTLKLYFPLYSAAATKLSLSLCTTRWGVGG